MARSAVPAFIPCHPPLIHHFIDIRQLRPPFHGCFHCRYTFHFSSNRMSSACAVKQNCHCLLLLPVHNPTAAFGTATFPWGRDIYRLPVSLVPLANIAILAPSPFLSPQNKRRRPCDDCPEPPRILFTNPYISRPIPPQHVFRAKSQSFFLCKGRARRSCRSIRYGRRNNRLLQGYSRNLPFFFLTPPTTKKSIYRTFPCPDPLPYPSKAS